MVPLLLSGGYHVHVDIASAVASAPGAVAAAALGPDPRLAELLVQRLRENGSARREDGDAVVVAAAGSSDARAVADVAAVVDAVRERWDGPVSVGFGSIAAPPVAEAVARARADHPGRRVAVAAYLLAPGFFHDRLGPRRRRRRRRAARPGARRRAGRRPAAGRPGAGACRHRLTARAAAVHQ